MRTLGPRSVASFLKVFLEIAFVVVCAIILVSGVYALLSAMAMVNPEPFDGWRAPRTHRHILAQTPQDAARLLLFSLYLLGFLAIIGRLRKIFVTLVQGQPFVAENARRLRVIGLTLAALEFSRFGIWALLTQGLGAKTIFFRPDINFTALFGIGVMFVLAEVFDEGVRMRKDLDLTI